MTEQHEIINEHEAKARLDATIRQHLGDDWDDPLQGWTLVSGHNYMARLTNGKRTVDFYVDLLGEVTVEEKATIKTGSSSWMAAWVVLWASVTVAYLIARFSGML
jgi:hypothetical protein